VTPTPLHPGLWQAFPRSPLAGGDSLDCVDRKSNRNVLGLAIAIEGKPWVGSLVKHTEVEPFDGGA
jgi:hypothetical protein